jgi:hypothetical protein
MLVQRVDRGEGFRGTPVALRTEGEGKRYPAGDADRFSWARLGEGASGLPLQRLGVPERRCQEGPVVVPQISRARRRVRGRIRGRAHDRQCHLVVQAPDGLPRNAYSVGSVQQPVHDHSEVVGAASSQLEPGFASIALR